MIQIMSKTEVVDYLARQPMSLDRDIFVRPLDPWVKLLMDEESHKARLEHVRFLSEGTAYRPPQ